MYYTIKKLIKNTEESSILDKIFKINRETIISYKFITLNVDKDYKINIKYNVAEILNDNMKEFLNKYPDFVENKQNYYREFRIPKRHGGYRELIEPCEDLKNIQRIILNILQNNLYMFPHNCAYAFTAHRDAVNNAEQHKNDKCFITLDVHNFFPSITTKILEEQLKNNLILYKINRVYNDFLNNLIKICTYKDALPQGSPTSPFLSNIIMMDFDYKVCKKIKEKELPYYTYTRYADDMCFSASKFTDKEKFVNEIDNLLKSCYNNSIQLNKDKTKFLKTTGKCYITGVKINSHNDTTYGHEHKKLLKNQLFNIFVKYQNNELTVEEAREVLGRFAYMKRIEPKYADYLEKKMLKQFNSTACKLSKHFKF